MPTVASSPGWTSPTRDGRSALELDSRRYHLSIAAFEADRPRQNRLEILGWTVLRYTWLHYIRSPMKIVSDVSVALESRPNANMRHP